MIDRRRFIAGLGAVSVLGFDPTSRSWVTEAHAAAPFASVPTLDGIIVSDANTLAAAATDVGNIIHRTPVAVLRPGSVQDIAKMVKYCREHHIKVAARGQGHQTFGQAQVEGGLVVDMSSLNTIYSISAAGADIAAGAKWQDLLLAAVPRGLTVQVITGYTALSIGGTLSVGGISANYRAGAQVDHVQRLQVVTGTGDIVWCSAQENTDLFEGVLAGLGQYGIITRAVVDTKPVKAEARVSVLAYTDNANFFRDMRILLDRGELDDIYTLWVPNPGGGWLYLLNAVKYFDADAPPDTDYLLRGLSQVSGAASVSDSDYLGHVLQVDGAIEYFKSIGHWDGVAHPWFDVFLPDTTVESYVGDVLRSLAPEDVGAFGFMLLLPVRPSALTRPLLRVPDCTKWAFLFDILTAAPEAGPSTDFVSRMLKRNRRLFEKARLLGGTRYPIGATPFTRVDWIFQYGEQFPRVVRLKRRYDPDVILTPGPGIF